MTRSRSITPSALESLDDVFLTLIPLISIIYSYMNEDDDEHDPFISPLYIDDPEVLEGMPKTNIYIGSLDSLLDCNI